MAGSFIWYELVTPDADGSKRFYDRVVGWSIAPQSDFPNGYRMIGRSDGRMAGGLLPLTEAMKEHGARPIWLGYIHVDDVDATAAAIAADGGKMLMEPFDIPGAGRTAFVTDPVGAPFYIMTPTPPPDQPDGQSDVFDEREVERFGWNELTSSDSENVRAFYEKHFGWSTGEFMDMGPMGKYRFIDHGGRRIGAMCGTVPGAAGGWRYYVNVPSIAAAVEAVNAGGGTVKMGPHEVPGGMHIIIADDPQGAEFALVGGA